MELEFQRQETATRLARLERATFGSVDRCSKNTSTNKTKTCDTTKTQLTLQLTPRSEKQGKMDTNNLPVELAEIVAVWAELPKYIKAAIKALVQTNVKGTK